MGCEGFHRKRRIEAEQKFYLLSKRGKGLILRGIDLE
jgi:hypothetical protein